MNKVNQEIVDVFYGHKCNYACYGCLTGCNYVRNKSYDPELEDIYKGVELLAERFDITEMVTLLGGDIFLYWDTRVVPLARHLRKCFPDTKINMTTNGQLIHKYAERVIDLMKEIGNVSLSITRHLNGIRGSRLYDVWNEHINQFLNHPDLVKIHDDHYHIRNNIYANIHFDVPTFLMFYKQEGQQIKPYATNNPAKSMEVSCPGNMCSCLVGTRLFKCTNLALLPHTLEELGQTSDPNWQKYLDYKYVDLLNPNSETLDFFIKTYTHPISECDMCSDNHNTKLTYDKRTEEKIFKLSDLKKDADLLQ